MGSDEPLRAPLPRSASTLRIAGVRTEADAPGAPPGLDEWVAETATPPEAGSVQYSCIDFGPDHVDSIEGSDDLEGLLSRPRAPGTIVRWINVDGLHPYVVNRFRAVYDFHALAAEDVVHVPQRPRAEPYEGHVFIVTRMISLVGDELVDEQISMFVFEDLLITFQEEAGDCWDPIRKRIRTEGAKIRERDPGYLAYALLDSVVDYNFPVLEHYSDHLDAMEDEVTTQPSPDLLKRIQFIKRDLSTLRRVIWPTRDLTDQLLRGETPLFNESTRMFLRDVYAHTVQLLDILDHHRETCANLTELYVSSVSNRMNEIMKLLTILTSLFIPVTFLAGVYGMNFAHIPEMDWKYAYPTFWATCIVTMGSLLFYFRRKGWIGESPAQSTKS